MKTKENKQAFRLSVFFTLIAAIFYKITFFITGLPAVNKIILARANAAQPLGTHDLFSLSFAISRWWDLLVVFALIFLLTKLNLKEKLGKHLRSDLVNFALISLVISIIVSTATDVIFAYMFALILGFIISFYENKIIIFVGAVIGLVFTLYGGFMFSLLITSIFFLENFVIKGIKFISICEQTKKIKNWLMAND